MSRITDQQMTVNGRHVRPGTELSITGEPGRFRFIKHVLTDQEESITVYGGTKNYQAFRSFVPDRIRRVHYKDKMRG